MNFQKQTLRSLFFLFLLICLLSGLVGVVSVPVNAAPKLANALDVVINEIAWSGTAAFPGDEWIELYNNTSAAIPLTNWRIEAEDGDPIINLSAYTIPANGYLLLERGNSNATSVSTVPGIETGTYFAGLLSDTGETLFLLDESSSTIDSVNSNRGGWPAGTLSPAGSMERYNTLSGENDFLWVTNDGTGSINGTDAKSNPIHGTPGNINQAFSITPPTFTTITEIAPTPSGVGALVDIKVKVDGILPPATGSVSVSDGTNIICIISSLSSGAGTCSGSFTSVGTKTVSATFTSDTGRPSSIGTKTHVVLPVSNTTTTITMISPEPSGVGLAQAVNVAVQVSGGSTPPTGTVNITGADTNCSFTLSSGIGNCNIYFSTTGTKNVTATYTGDSTHANSSSTVPHVVTVISSTTTIINSDTPDPSSTGQGVRVTVTVSGGLVIPTGTVNLSGANTNCSITLVGGTGNCLVYFTSVGTKTITATYIGDSIHTGSSDTEAHQVFIPTPIPTSTRFVFRTATPVPLPPPPLIGINEFVPRPGHDWNNDGVVNVGDEYIELLNHGVVDVNLSGYTLDDEANIGSTPYRLPSVILKPGERKVFYGKDTGLLLSDGGDGVRLNKPNGQLGDAYNYTVVKYPDQAYCRLPDNGGLDDWNTNCFPTPGLKNSLSGSFSRPPTEEDDDQPLCPISDTLPLDFVWAECPSFGNIWSRFYWDAKGWFGEMVIPDLNSKWDVYVD